jgi:5'-3' exonuclease
MTITGLTRLFHKFNVPFLGRDKKSNDKIPAYINQLRDRTLAVDTSMIIYKANSYAIDAMCSMHHFVRGDDGKWDMPDRSNHIEFFRDSITSYINGMKRTGVSFIFVIEGGVPKMKEGTSAKRRQDRLARSLMEYSDLNSHIRSMKDKYLLTEEHQKVTIEVLKELECRVLQAKYESEGVCAHLVRTKRAHGALSDDGDLVMLGCPIMIRKLRSLKLETGHFEYHGLALIDVLLSIGFLSERLRSDHPDYIRACSRLKVLCILSGTDYYDTINRMGIIKIYNLMINNDCYTYEDVCVIDPRFQEIPYYEILKTLEENTEFTVIN